MDKERLKAETIKLVECYNNIMEIVDQGIHEITEEEQEILSDGMAYILDAIENLHEYIESEDEE